MPELTPSARIAQGRTAEVFAWGEGKILKLFFDWCPPDWVQHESKISQILAESYLPVPKWYGMTEVDQRQGIIYERILGRSMLSLMTARPWLLVRYAREFAGLHAGFHRCDQDGLGSLRDSLRTTIQRVEILPADTKNQVLAILEDLPDGAPLCHFDFHPGQVMITSKGPIVLDWMTAFRGEPAADVARTEIIMQVGQLPYGGQLQRSLVNVWRGEFNRVYLARYLELNPGVSRESIDRWLIPVAAGRLAEKISGEQDQLLALIQKGIKPG